MEIMKIRGLLIATLVLAGLAAVLYWSNHHPASEGTAGASPDTPPKILALKQDDITKLDIKKRGSEVAALEKDDAGKWQITAPKTLSADQDAVSSMLSTISSLNSDRLVDEKPTDLGQYGLAKPTLEIAVTEKDKSQKLLIGDSTPSGNAVFVKLEGDSRVFTLASYNKDSLDKNADDLRDKRMLTADFDKVSQIELVTQKGGNRQDITFGRNKDAWQILKPMPFRADRDRVEDLIRTLRDAKMDIASATDDTKTTAAFKSAQSYATVKVTGASGVQELEVRNVKDNCYAKSSVVSGIYKVPASVGTGLDKGLDDFANKKVFDFGYQEPNKIEIHDGTKSYVLTHSGSDWWGPDGKKMDEINSQTLVTRLRELSATKFSEARFAVPTIEITVISNDGKRVERVSITKKDDAYIAKRENESALYELPSSSVLQLEEAAANIKAQESPPK